MLSLLFLIDQIIGLYMWCLIIVVAMSWLTTFNVINTQNKFVYQIYDFMYRITEPALRPIRRWIPNFGGIDISPVILILLLVFIRNLMKEYGSNLVWSKTILKLGYKVLIPNIKNNSKHGVFDKDAVTDRNKKFKKWRIIKSTKKII